MELRDADKLVNEMHVMSKLFKTNHKYGYQPVVMPAKGTPTWPLLKLYVQNFRPTAVQNADDESLNDSSARLWLHFDGTPVQCISHLVTNFSEQKLSIHMTPTKLRSLVETETELLLEADKITTAERAAVRHINGHSSAITQQFYVRRSREQDVENGRRAFSQFASSAPTINHQRCEDDGDGNDGDRYDDADGDSVADIYMGDDSEDLHYNNDIQNSPVATLGRRFRCDTNVMYNTPPQHRNNRISNVSVSAVSSHSTFRAPEFRPERVRQQAQQKPWGTAHPDAGKALSEHARFRWSAAEVNYIGEWCLADSAANPHRKSTIVSRCLRAIHCDPSATSIFHAQHVLNSVRLKHGYKKFFKL
jgi:hypothetical protein